MYRLSPELAKEVMSRIKAPEIESSGPNAFLPKNFSSVGIIDPIVAIGTDYFFVLECPIPVVYPELQYIPTLKGYFLYKKEELKRVEEPWEVQRLFLDPICTSVDERLDVREAAVMVASDVDKLTCQTISTIEKLIEKEPLIIDCIDLSRK